MKTKRTVWRCEVCKTVNPMSTDVCTFCEADAIDADKHGGALEQHIAYTRPVTVKDLADALDVIAGQVADLEVYGENEMRERMKHIQAVALRALCKVKVGVEV